MLSKMNKTFRKDKSTLTAWSEFLLGLVLLTLMVLFFASGYTPPGICGKVLRHNQEYNIDASPLWYMDVENMSELEDGVQELRKRKIP